MDNFDALIISDAPEQVKCAAILARDLAVFRDGDRTASYHDAATWAAHASVLADDLEATARTKPPAPDRPTREAVARIIDPKGWEACERHHNTESAQMYVKDSLAKADAILAMIQPPPSCGSDEVRAVVHNLEFLRKRFNAHASGHAFAQWQDRSRAFAAQLGEAGDLITTLAQRVEVLEASRNHHRGKADNARTVRNRALNGLEYFKERATTAEATLAELKAQGAGMAEGWIAARNKLTEWLLKGEPRPCDEKWRAAFDQDLRLILASPPPPRLDDGWRPVVTDLIAYANDVRWIELAQGMAFGGDDRAMVARLIAKAKAAKRALPASPQVDGGRS